MLGSVLNMMNPIEKWILGATVSGMLCLMCTAAPSGGGNPPEERVTYAVAATVLAHGTFHRYVDREAGLNQCVQFLNAHGIHIDSAGLSEPLPKKELARLVAQSVLVRTGEAEYESGRVILPPDADSWVDYCLLYDINVDHAWAKLMDFVRENASYVRRLNGEEIPNRREEQ
ncbi:hypothetical protein L21SP4_01940 [Kiritimatiella glycovorans]|uniref:Uncharacterized protein n=2 Tax=Kiritimatiella glycovorans TaxID=1307763 RepID=A0A0G3EK43_9BACT|nr:hypothetical protein L21SP4_01940 [Kiritimatiella glycovorans]